MSSIVTIEDGTLITDSRADINNNFSALNTDKVETSVIDTDTTLAADSDAKLASQKAVKAYIDTGGSTIPVCRVIQTGGTSLAATATFYVMDFASEAFDTDTMHDNSTNPSRITFTTAGKYMVGGQVAITTSVTAALQVRLNGSTIIALHQGAVPTSPSHNGHCSISLLYSFSADDYIEFMSNASVSSRTTSGDLATNAWAHRVSD